MKISSVRLQGFKRFTDLTIEGLPDTARLVVLTGPNGCGKSSLFDAFIIWQRKFFRGYTDDTSYYWKDKFITSDTGQRINVQIFGQTQDFRHMAPHAFYFRTAHRNDPEFQLAQLNRVGPAVDEHRFERMINTDAAVTLNYQRLTSQALQSAFVEGDPTTTLGQFRNDVIGEIKRSFLRLFPGLELVSLGDPLLSGTFRFDKGASRNFDYKNLSGGEKAAFDLLSDLIIKRTVFSDTIFCIDEPEAHLNTRLQGALLGELYDLIPSNSQIWIASHSIGMMRKARELASANPNEIVFLDFEDRDFDSPVTITPSKPTRSFWEKILRVALDDLSHLVTPAEVVICEGNPSGPVAGKNADHDAQCYNVIFSEEFPDTKFLSGGNSHDVSRDRLAFVTALPEISKGIKVGRLIDRDDHAPQDIARLNQEGIRVLNRRHIECYLFDDEVLEALCRKVGNLGAFPDLQAAKIKAISDSVGRGNAADDVKSAAGTIYSSVR